MGERALSIKADTFAFFTRNPRGGQAKDIDANDAENLIDLMNRNDFGKVVGASVVNALSSRLDVEVDRNGTT